jgi:hypothetical protein
MSAPRANPLMPVDPTRLRHGRGEALLGRDFTEQAAQDDQLRWWHSRALHNAYGLVDGLEVIFALARTFRIAEVQPGLAYDCHGRELLLDRPQQIVVPEDEKPLVLVIASGAPDVASSSVSGGWCHDDQVGPGHVVLRWLPRSGFTPRDGVPLATNDETVAFSAPQARPFARPRIGRGATITGATAWRPWVEVFADHVLALGIQVDVDTSAAGFTAVPCYFAQITGAMWTPQVPRVLLLPFVHIAQAAKDGFTYRLLAPWLYGQLGPNVPELGGAEALSRPREADFRLAFLALGRATNLAVAWIGIQQRNDTDGGIHGLS